METKLQSLISKAFKDLFNCEVDESTISLTATKKEFKGDFTLVVFPFLQKCGEKNPVALAQKIGEYVVEKSEEIEGFNVIKGFLNFEISPKYWLKFLNDNYQNTNYGYQPKKNDKTIVIEYSSPNTNKPLHLGHIRNNLLGWSVAQILKANGYDVKKVNLVNDRGIHICKSMLAWQKFSAGETPEKSGMKGDHLVGKYYVEFDKAYKAEIADLIARSEYMGLQNFLYQLWFRKQICRGFAAPFKTK